MSNITAFLDVLKQCEGTDYPDGAFYLVGSNPHNNIRAKSLVTHPNISMPFGKGQHSTAAGFFQILYGTWQDLCKKLHLSDFSASTQESMATELLRECGAYNALIQGDLLTAVEKASHTWASLPFSPYGQPTKTYQQIKQWYILAGGQTKAV